MAAVWSGSGGVMEAEEGAGTSRRRPTFVFGKINFQVLRKNPENVCVIKIATLGFCVIKSATWDSPCSALARSGFALLAWRHQSALLKRLLRSERTTGALAIVNGHTYRLCINWRALRGI